MQHHFKVAGDFDPTKQEEVHLDMIDIKDIYEEYTADMKHFFNYEQVPQMLETLYSQFKEINKAADFIYDNLLASETPETEGVVS